MSNLATLRNICADNDTTCAFDSPANFKSQGFPVPGAGCNAPNVPTVPKVTTPPPTLPPAPIIHNITCKFLASFFQSEAGVARDAAHDRASCERDRAAVERFITGGALLCEFTFDGVAQPKLFTKAACDALLSSFPACTYTYNKAKYSGYNTSECTILRNILGFDAQGHFIGGGARQTSSQSPTASSASSQAPSASGATGQIQPTGAPSALNVVAGGVSTKAPSNSVPTNLPVAPTVAPSDVKVVAVGGSTQAPTNSLPTNSPVAATTAPSDVKVVVVGGSTQAPTASKSAGLRKEESTTQTQSTTNSNGMPAWGWVLVGLGAALGLALIIGAAVILQRSYKKSFTETV
jgi:hypothetical protein